MPRQDAGAVAAMLVSKQNTPLNFPLPNRNATIYRSSDFFLDEFPNSTEPLANSTRPTNDATCYWESADESETWRLSRTPSTMSSCNLWTIRCILQTLLRDISQRCNIFQAPSAPSHPRPREWFGCPWCENLKSLRTMFWCVRVFWLENFVGRVSVKALKCLRN